MAAAAIISTITGGASVLAIILAYLHLINPIIPTPPTPPPAPVPIVLVPPTPSSNIYACADVRPASAIGGDTVTLDGSCSTTDPNGLIMSYSWKQLHGHRVHLNHDTDRISTFTVPHITHLTTLTFQLAVTDNHHRRDVVIKDIIIN